MSDERGNLRTVNFSTGGPMEKKASFTTAPSATGSLDDMHGNAPTALPDDTCAVRPPPEIIATSPESDRRPEDGGEVLFSANDNDDDDGLEHDDEAQPASPIKSVGSAKYAAADHQLTHHSSDGSQSDGEGGFSSGASFSSNGTASTSSSANRHLGTTTLRCAGLKFKIPFTFWTFMAMAVPIALIVAVLTRSLWAHVHELHVIADHKHFASEIEECATGLMLERKAIGPVLTRPGVQRFRDELARARDVVDNHCAVQVTGDLQALAQGSTAAAPELWLEEARRHVALMRELSIWRERVDLSSSSLSSSRFSQRSMRAFYTTAIAATSEMITPIADALDMASRKFSELLLIISVRSQLSAAADMAEFIGFVVLANSPDRAAFEVEFHRAHSGAEVAGTHLRGMADPVLRDKVNGWAQHSDAMHLWAALDAAAADLAGTAARFGNNITEWQVMTSAALDQLVSVEQRHLARIHEATKAKEMVRDESLILGIGVSVCLIVAGLLAYRQSGIRADLEAQVQQMAKIKAAVSAFVPRFFLRKMGYTSIIQVCAGDATNVALAMLFSDIRRFTTVAEGMQSSDLFEWVQGYFKRMTTIVDSRRGNVNQFVGDALFAVFSTANDALQCAVDMQADVEQLNVQRRRDDQTITPLEVGMGIHHDVVALGILGDDKRHTCTAISASVNLASRLEGLTKQLGCKIIASGEAMAQLTAPELAALRSRRLGGVVVKGTWTPTMVHDVFHADDRDLQLYKQSTRNDFEAVMNACIYHDPDESTHDVLRGRLESHVATATTFIKRGSVSVEDPAALHTPSESFTSPRATAAASPLLLRSQECTGSGHAAMARFSSPQESPHAAEIDRVLEALNKYAVRDLALEAFCALADGSGSVAFVKK